MPDFIFTNVDSDIINNVVFNIDDYIKKLQAISSMFENSIISNIDSYWQGQAREEFKQQYFSFTLELKNLIDRYNELNWKLKNAGIEYGRVDDSVKQIITKLPK